MALYRHVNTTELRFSNNFLKLNEKTLIKLILLEIIIAEAENFLPLFLDFGRFLSHTFYELLRMLKEIHYAIFEVYNINTAVSSAGGQRRGLQCNQLDSSRTLRSGGLLPQQHSNVCV